MNVFNINKYQKNKHHHLEIVDRLVQSPVYEGHYNELI